MFSYRIFRDRGETLLAFCDSGLLGKKLDGPVIFEVRESFYGGSECGETEIKSLAKDATVINAVGRDAVELLVRENIIERENVIMVGGVPHAQFAAA